ncbi:hypothetical protein [Winogradskyella sp.]|uniref:hypothetical protein n=1 Tax=Winogradskyella sp. TaxID=1883156 RepID=UPI003BAC1D6F
MSTVLKTSLFILLSFVLLITQNNKASELIVNKNSSKTMFLDLKHRYHQNKEKRIIKTLVNKNWEGTGTLMGKKATFKMNWQNVLNDQFIKLEFQNEHQSENNEAIVFKATAFYNIINDTIVTGHWFDNRGISLPLKGQVNDDTLTIFWGNSDTETGKTIYKYINDSSLHVEDYILSNATYHKFGNATYSVK